MIKYYRYDEEIKICPVERVEDGKIRYCESPLFDSVPGCLLSYYCCERERLFGPVKHNPNPQWYDRVKMETLKTCRDLPIEYCLRLVKAPVECPMCNSYHEEGDVLEGYRRVASSNQYKDLIDRIGLIEKTIKKLEERLERLEQSDIYDIETKVGGDTYVEVD